MPILTRVGRKSPAQRLARGVVLAALSIGAVAVLYPLLLVFGQALSSDFDLRENAVVPRYLYDRDQLALKYVFSLHKDTRLLAARHHRNEWTSQDAMRADREFAASRPATLARQGLSLDAWPTMIQDLNDFTATLAPDEFVAVRFLVEDHYRPFLRRKYGAMADGLRASLARGEPSPSWLAAAFPDPVSRARLVADRDRLGLAFLNHNLDADYRDYESVEAMRPGDLLVPTWRPARSPKSALWQEFLASLPPEARMLVPSDAYWQYALELKYVTVERLNAAWGSAHRGFFELRLPLEPPGAGPVRADWEQFVVRRWPRRLLHVPPEFAPAWRRTVRARALARVPAGPGADARALAELDRDTGLRLRRWEDLPLPRSRPANDTLSRYWCEFTLSGAVPPTRLALNAPETRFREFLRRRYGEGKDEAAALRALNAAWQARFASFVSVPLPLALADTVTVQHRAGELRRRFATEAFRRTAAYLFGHGRAAWNTLVLVLLSLATALTVNPIAAYSLSRFSMRQSHRVLLFFLATMAFPAEVAMIPNFLLLRQLHLLNTYAALIVPGLANGFSIFLLKCFFDSLPRELIEAAELDGANEVQVFGLVSIPMLKPILAYIGLNAFVAAYSGFMWAFVICPREEMWTLMVWAFDFQSRNAGDNYVMAMTILVSIPPLLVFLLANRIIMRGILIPSMK